MVFNIIIFNIFKKSNPILVQFMLCIFSNYLSILMCNDAFQQQGSALTASFCYFVMGMSCVVWLTSAACVYIFANIWTSVIITQLKDWQSWRKTMRKCYGVMDWSECVVFYYVFITIWYHNTSCLIVAVQNMLIQYFFWFVTLFHTVQFSMTCALYKKLIIPNYIMNKIYIILHSWLKRCVLIHVNKSTPRPTK